MSNAKCFEVYTTDGSLICRAYLTEREMPEGSKEGPVRQIERAPEKKNGEPMTGPQKRMLFRLMATTNRIEGEKAHEELKKRFRVKSLQDVSKLDASRMIEHLMEAKGGNGHGSSL
ncbi:MAG: hypothetical protein WEF53_06250 [Bacteroidota bacterium]